METTQERLGYVNHLRDEIRRLQKKNDETLEQINKLELDVVDLERQYSWREYDIDIMISRLEREITALESLGVKVDSASKETDDDFGELS